MTTAPIAQQRKLIELQSLDSSLVRLQHERHHLPVLEQIEATVNSLKENRRAAVLADAALSEAKKAATRAEDDVNQVEQRATTLRARLSADGTSAKDLSAIQGELDQMARRKSVLEDAQIEALEVLEDARGRVAELASAEGEIRSGGRELTAQRDADFARIDRELAETTQQRELLAATVDAALLAEYEAVREATGGLGVVALYGTRVEGAVEISPQEMAQIQATSLDTVIHSEENDVIIVRMND